MKRIEIYNKNKAAKVGSTCVCPSCNTSFLKQNYQQAFCKSKQGTKCKDYYWNMVVPERRNNKTRVSPARQFYLLQKAISDIPVVIGFGDSQKAIDKMDQENDELNSGGGWFDHGCNVERCKWCNCLTCRCE